jgi:hypothetical protein
MYKYKCYEAPLDFPVNDGPLTMVSTTQSDPANRTADETLLNALFNIEQQKIHHLVRSDTGRLMQGIFNENENFTCLNKCSKWMFKKAFYQRTLTEEVCKYIDRKARNPPFSYYKNLIQVVTGVR